MTRCEHFNPIVSAIDADDFFLKEINALVATIGLYFEAFRSSDDFFGAHPEDFSGCVILEARLPGSNGLDIQTRMRELGFHVPVLFATGYGDVWTAVQAMKCGALDFVEKPVQPQQFLSLVQEGIARSRKHWIERMRIERLARSMHRITDRELDVLGLMVRKETNKDIASELGVSIKTVEYHKSNIYRKLPVEQILNMRENPTVINEIRALRKENDYKDISASAGAIPQAARAQYGLPK